MKKRLLLFLFVIGILMQPMVINAYSVENKLNDSHKNVYAGSNFTSMDTFYLNNPLNITNLNLSDPTADFSFWHFIDSGKQSEYAIVTFRTEDGVEKSYTITPDPKSFGQHYAVITPSSWKLLDGISYANKSGNFNLSHSGRHEATMGKIRALAYLNPFYYEVIPHKYYERTVDKFYERTVDKFYERTVVDYYQRTVDEFYERKVDEYYFRDVIEYYHRYAQQYAVPVFSKKVNSIDNTLVTRLTYNNDTNKAEAINGGVFKNGHTYVEIDVNDAESEEGIWFTIADSSKNNGKKTPDKYNRPIDYKYNVRIYGNKLIISFDDDLVSASVGAYVVNNPKDFPGNAPKHYKNTAVISLPKDYKSTVYLYTHIESLNWYDNEGAYEFVEWRMDESKTKYFDYELDRTEKGSYELYDKVEHDYDLVKTEYGDYVYVKTEYGDYKLVDTKYGDFKLVKTEYGEYELVKSSEVRNKKFVSYEGTLTLTVNGEVMPLNQDLILAPGIYTFTLSGTGNVFETVSKIVTIRTGINDDVLFDDFIYTLADDIKNPVIHEEDLEATIHEENLEATIHEKDLEATRNDSDQEAKKHYKDIEGEKFWLDKETIKEYKELYIFRPVINLGNEIDPYNIYAIRLN
ncbi:MAG: hypothetical protein PHO63_00405 [Bacilli bacterium]|nr:hypothetical protein [Bacilli bacterium]MDD4808668.1 hypothetical protein [Bacilli bacterium]